MKEVFLETLRNVRQVQKIDKKELKVVIARGIHLFPFRTEKLSLVTPMVLRNSGRVGSRRFRERIFRERMKAGSTIVEAAFFVLYIHQQLPSTPWLVPIFYASFLGF